MRFNKTKGANWVIAMALLALPGALITSCSKDKAEIVQQKGDKLTFSVSGIKNENADTGVKRAGLSSTSKTVNKSKIYSFDDVDMAVSTDNTLPVSTSNIANAKRSNGLAADATPGTTENIAQDVKYVVYIYSGNTLVTSKVFQAGTDGTIDGLDPATTYTWVALSYNTADDQPTENPANNTITLPQNKDVLYAKGTVNLASDSNISILFNHAFSRIGIELNTIGVFGNITGTPTVNVSGLQLASGDINLMDGTVTPGAAFTPTLSYADFVNVDPAYNDAKIAYVYTASTAAQTAIKVQLQNLNISHADGNVAREYFKNATDFNFQVTPEIGKSHHLLLNVVESPLTTNLESTTVKWARSNLYDRNNNDALRGYAFYATNEQRSRADGYFSYKGLRAGQFPSSTTSGDPCTKVYPEGLWKQPTVAQVNSLTTGNAGLLSSVLDVLGSILPAEDKAPGSSVGTTGGNHAQYNIISGGTTSENAFGAPGSNSNNLRFFYNGQITDLSVLAKIGTDGKGLLGLGLSNLSVDLLGYKILGTTIPVLGTSYNSTTALWTSTDIVPGFLGLDLGSYGYVASTERAKLLVIPVGPPFIRAKTTAELLSNVGIGGLTLLNTSFKNVRCVRAN